MIGTYGQPAPAARAKGADLTITKATVPDTALARGRDDESVGSGHDLQHSPVHKIGRTH
jgi:hypothetical protein